MRSRESARRASCQSSLKQTALGILAYLEDYGGKWPLARGDGIPNDPGFGWAGSTQPYLKCTQILRCPGDFSPQSGATGGKGFSDYWINSRLCGQEAASMPRRQTVFLEGDGDGFAPDSDASCNKSEFPANWRQIQGDGQAPWFLRHVGGANYSFADGHVKWLKPGELSNDSGRPYTFAIR